MRRSWLVGLALLASVGSHAASAAEGNAQLRLGERVVPFKVATSDGAMADYTRDYYGSHHLVLTFFPAAFTPV